VTLQVLKKYSEETVGEKRSKCLRGNRWNTKTEDITRGDSVEKMIGF
jgi:hypothetical protein